MRPDELMAVAALWWESSMSAPVDNAGHPTVAAMAERLAQEPWRLTVADRAGVMVGLLAVQAQDRWLRQLYVAPAVKGSGIGTRLLHDAKRQMPEGFFLHTDADNAPARRFYEARGLACEAESPYPGSGRPRVRYVWRGA
jgi:ribosomal protein S18 acetylase RimI-like enzyme